MPPLQVPWERFDQLLAGVISGAEQDGVWGDFGRVLRSYRVWKAGDRQDARRIINRCDGVLTQGLHAWYDKLSLDAS